MPIKDHPIFNSPQEGQALWRYISFPKFVSLLTTSGIWFTNAEVLSEIDPFEATLPNGNYSHRHWDTAEDVPQDVLEKFKSTMYTRVNHPSEETINQKIAGEKALRDLRIRQSFLYRKEKYVNCWHASDAESAAMWHVYGSDQHGIALVSNLNRIKKALQDFSETIYCGYIKYIDYEKEALDLSNAFYPIVHKRLSFEFEKEVRFVFSDYRVSYKEVKVILASGEKGFASFPKSDEEVIAFNAAPGVLIGCNINTLIEEVKIAPTAPEWFESAVRELCVKFKLNMPIRKSNLYSDPVR